MAYKRKERPGFLITHRSRVQLEFLTDEQRGRLLMALLDYSEKGISSSFNGVLGMAYATMAQQVDFDTSAWNDKCQRNSENRRSRENENRGQERSTMVDECSCFDRGDHNKTEQHRNKTEQNNIVRVENLFAEFWSCYPKKKGKDAARKAFEKVLCRVDHQTLIDAVERQKVSADWKKDGGQFIPHPATWLNQGRWMDETDAPAPPYQNQVTVLDRVIDYDAMEFDEDGKPIGLEAIR